MIDGPPGRFGDALGKAVLKRVGRLASQFQEQTPLGADVLEGDEEYLVVFDAPGVEARDVDVTVDEDGVRVRIDRFRDFHEGFETVMAGRGLSLHGHADLPGDADLEEGEARAELNADGTLFVFVPKAERVSVEVEAPSEAEDVDVA